MALFKKLFVLCLLSVLFLAFTNCFDGFQQKSFDLSSFAIPEDINEPIISEEPIDEPPPRPIIEEEPIIDYNILEFNQIKTDYNNYYVYKGHVYLKENKLAEASAVDFYVLKDGEYGSDSQLVFYQDQIINNADRNTFAIIKDDISEDQSHVFCKSQILSDADPNTFDFDPQNNFYRDQDHVFIGCDIVSNDPENFKRLGNDYSIDSRGVYYNFKAIEGADIRSFEQVKDSQFYRDNENIYIFGEKINNLDLGSFYHLQGLFFKDNQKIFYKDKPIYNADYYSFEMLNEYVAKDKNRIYIHERKITVGNISSFTCESKNKCEDSKSWYHIDEYKSVITLKPRN